MNYLAAEESLREILNIDKPPALPKFRPDYLNGVNLCPADWSLSGNYEEDNKCTVRYSGSDKKNSTARAKR